MNPQKVVAEFLGQQFANLDDFKTSLDNLLRRTENKEGILINLKNELDSRIQVRI
jgi:hypothetical protein